MKPASKQISRLLQDLFRVEPLESRLLLSADPVLGAAQIVLQPSQDADAAVAQAYAAPADVAVSTAPGATVLVANGAGQQAGTPAEWLTVDTSQLAGGNGRVVVGGADSNAVIRVGDSAGGTVHLGDLVLVNPQAGGEVFLDGDLQLAGSLLIEGSGHTTIVAADTASADDIFILDSVVVTGHHTLAAGNDGTGNIQLGSSTAHSVNGNGDSTPDTLVLRAADSVRFTGQVGGTDALEGLTIDAVIVAGNPNTPFNVDFDREVTVDGDLVINASGTVTFTQQVIIRLGGDLRITGADHVVFKHGLVLEGVNGLEAGDIFIEANEISFLGGGESVSGKGSLTLRPTRVGDGIELGTPPASVTGNTLNLDNAELQAFAESFNKIVIGHQDGLHAKAGAGTVRVGAINALDQPTLRDALEIYGGAIVVEDYSTPDYRLQVLGSIKLDATGDITIRNSIEAWTGSEFADISLHSATGRVAQVNATNDGMSSEPLRARNLTVQAATGISLPFTEVATVNATNTAAGDLRITETAAGGDVTIALLNQAAANAAISLKTTSGSITVAGAGISNAGSGLTELQAAGTAQQITVNQSIYSGAGTIRLTASGAIATEDNGGSTSGMIVTDGAADVELVASGGSIQQGGLVQSAGGLVSLDAFTTITMADGARTQSLHPTADTGAVRLRANGNVTLSTLAADGLLTVTAGGSILDGLTGNNANLDGETAAVLLAAVSGIGSSTTALQTRVQSLAASNTTTGGIFLREATALRILGGSGSYAIDAGGSDGSVAIVTADGALTVEKAVRSTGTLGHLLLQSGESGEATVADLAVRAGVSSSRGSISVLSADGIVLDDLAAGTGPAISVAAAGKTIDLQAANSIAMEAQARIATAGGNVGLWAQGGSVALGTVDAGAGSVAVRALGSITDAQGDDAGASTINITGSALMLNAGGAIGAAGALLETQVATLSARAGAGAVFLAERDGLTVGAVSVDHDRVAADGSVAVFGAADVGGITASAALVLQAGGDLTLQSEVSATGAMRLAATGKIDAQANAGSTTGDVSVLAGNGVQLASGKSFYADALGKTMDIQATGGAVTLAATATVRTNGGAQRVQAATDVTLGTLDARTAADRAGNTTAGQGSWGSTSVVAGGAIAHAAGSATNLYALALRLQAGGGIGAATSALQTQVLGMSAAAGSAGLFITEATDLVIGSVGSVNPQRVATDGTSGAGTADALQPGLTSGGALVVRTLAGTLSISSMGPVQAAGNLLLQAQGATADLELEAAINSTSGSISLAAQGDVLLLADVTASASGRSIDIVAQGDVRQSAGQIATANGNIALQAGNLATFTQISAGTAGVWIGGADVSDSDAAGDTGVDIVAGSAQLLATTGDVGSAGAAIETDVATLTVSAPGKVFITEANGLVIDRLQIDVQRVAGDGTAAAAGHAAQEDLSAGLLVVTATAGNLVLNAGTAATAAVNGGLGGTGNVRLQAVAGQVQANAQVDAGSTNLSVLGASGVTAAASGSFTTNGGTLDLESTAGAVTLADGALARSNGGNIRLKAATDVTVGAVDARVASDRSANTLTNAASWGAVSVIAGGSILDNMGETATDLWASALRLQAGNAIASGSEHLETEVASRLSAVAGTGGVFLAEASDIALGGVAALTVQRVAADGVAAGLVDDAQSGVTSGGAAVVQTAQGSLTVRDAGVSAVGNVLLVALGETAALSVDAAVASSGGSIELAAQGNLQLSANVTTAAAGQDIVVMAGGSILQAQDTGVTSNDGAILLAVMGSTGTVTIEKLAAGTGTVLIAGGDGGIVDGDANGEFEDDTDIEASGLALLSRGAIGAARAQLETTVDTLTAQAAGNVFINETDALVLGTVTAVFQQIDATGAALAPSSLEIEGVSGANVVLRTLNGSLAGNVGAVVAASGNLLLQATGLDADLTLAASVSAAGALSLAADRDIVLTSSVTGTGAGHSVDLLAQRRIDAQQDSAISSNDGSISLQALAGSVKLESVNAGIGAVRLAGTSIIDGDSDAGESQVDVVAGQLQLTASGAIGTGANPLEIHVDTLTASGGGNVALAESDALVLGTVSTSVDRVDANGNANATSAVSQSGVGGANVIVRAAGTLQSLASGAVKAAGNLLLQASGTASDLDLAGTVASTDGHVTLDAGQDLLQDANVTLTGAGKSLELIAGRAIVQGQGAGITTSNGNAALAAAGSVTLEAIALGAGRLSISGTSVVDGDADLDADGLADNEVDVQAGGLRVVLTTGAIGSGANALETTISTLSVHAGGDIFITESDALELAPVSVTVNHVLRNGTDEQVTLQAQNGSSGATMVIRTLAGALGSQVNGGVTATGNVLLQAGGASSDLELGAAVASSGGHVSLHAGQDLLLGGNVSAAAADQALDLVAGRDLTQAQGTHAMTAGGNIALEVGRTATIEKLDAGAGGVLVFATSLLDGDTVPAEGEDDVLADILAARLQLHAPGTAGLAGNPLELTVATLAAGGGDLFASESDGLTIASVNVDGQRVGADGAAGLSSTLATTGVSAATLVLQTTTGSLQTAAGATVVATGNLLLAALAANADLVLGAAVIGYGDMTLSAGRDLQQDGDVIAATTTGGLVLQAGRDLTQADDVGAFTYGGPLAVIATGTATLEILSADAGVVRVQAATVVDRDVDGDSSTDITAGGLQIVTTGAFGSGENHIEVKAATLAAQTGGALFITEADALTIGAVSAVLPRVGSDGVTTIELVTTVTGIASGGDAVVGLIDGSLTVAADVSAAGNVWLEASGSSSDLVLGADVASTGGDIVLLAGRELQQQAGTSVTADGGDIVLVAVGSVAMAASTTVQTADAGTITVEAWTGTVLMDPDTTTLQTGTGAIYIGGEGDVRPGALVTQGHAYVNSRSGVVLVQGDLQRNGQDVDLIGNDLSIQAPIASPGGTLNISPVDAVPIVIGSPAPATSTAALYLDHAELALLDDGFAQIVIGSSLVDQSIELRGVAAPVVFRDPLVLTATGAGGTIGITGALQGDTLQINDSGTGTTLTGSTLTLRGDVLVDDQLTISGANSIAAGAGEGSTGTLRVTQAISGAGGTADSLALSAQGGDIVLELAVANLDGLSITEAVNVTFGAAVNLDGDLVIEASGVVTFTGPLTMALGGRLIVSGGALVVFANTADLGSGNALLQVSAIQANGGDGSVTGTGLLQVSGTTSLMAINVGSGTQAGALQIGDDVLRAVAGGFTSLRIGSGVTGGAITVGNSDFTITGSPVELLGSSITVAADGTGVRVGTDLSLHATGAITTSGQIVATAAVDLSFISDSGAVTMAAGARVSSAGGHVALSSLTGLAVATIDTRAEDGSSGTVSLRSEGRITDANADEAVDVYAQALDFAGATSPMGSPDVLEVSAPVVRVDVAAGIVTREAGIDGRTYFNVLRGGDLEQALVAVGPTSRVTTDPHDFIADGGLQQLNAGSPAPSSVAALQSLGFIATSVLPAANFQVQSYLSSSPAGVASALTLSQRLLEESELSFASGQPSGDGTGVDYWSENLAL